MNDCANSNFIIMKKIHYTVKINAPAISVYDIMLGITSKATYEGWTAIFNPTSSYEGSWDKGSKILFTGIDDKGQKGGMVSEIAENIACKFVSIRHYGLLQGDKEITEGPEVEKWAGGLENYSFEEDNGFCTLKVDLDTAEDFVDYMDQTYPEALLKLKELCEQN